MKRELVTTDAFEKKKSHVAWFTLILVTIMLAFDGTPIKFPGIDSSIPSIPAIFIVATALTYMLAAFWLESRRVIRINSSFVAGKEIDDTVAEISRSLDEVLAYLEKVGKAKFGPSPTTLMKDTIEDYKNRASSFSKALHEFQESTGEVEKAGRVTNFKTRSSVHLGNLIKIHEAFVDRLSTFPFNEIDPVIAAANGRRNFTGTISEFRNVLETEIKPLSGELKRLSDDILTEGKVQWRLERWPPFLVGSSAVLVAILIVVYPECYTAFRTDLIAATAPGQPQDVGIRRF